MNDDEIISEVKKIIRRYLGDDYKIILFGSKAKEKSTKYSDIDIGINGDKKVDEDILIRIKKESEALPTLKEIDIVDLFNVDKDFKEEVLKYGKQI